MNPLAEASLMPDRRTLTVAGMACTGCESNVETALETVDGIRSVEADYDAETIEVVVDDDVSDDRIGDAVHNAGYEFVG